MYGPAAECWLAQLEDEDRRRTVEQRGCERGRNEPQTHNLLLLASEEAKRSLGCSTSINVPPSIYKQLRSSGRHIRLSLR
jgi:hypothetical protein